jgi:pilus assembly protein FimV
MKGPRKTLLASSILVIPTLAQALGLGGIEVKSGLNEPLIAEIQVIQSAPGEADGLAVALASAEDFARVGIDRSRMEMPLSFAVGKSSSGQAVIKVTSATPVREPFLNFLLEVNWSKGRLLREYTVLLDPPVSAPARGSAQVATAPVREPTPAQPVAVAPPKPVAPAPAPAPTPAPTPAPAPSPAPAPAPAAAAAVPGEYGPVGQGETLWEIALATRPDGVADMNKFMISLLRMNPDAFFEQNINALKRGAILRIPGSDDVNAVSASEAAAAVRGQNEIWRGYQSAQAATPTRLADAGASESLRTPAATTTSSGSRLELLPPRAGQDQGAADRPGAAGLDRSGEEIKNLRGDLARSQEDLESSRQEVSELRSRVTDLEKIKTDQDKVLKLRNDELKSLQARAGELEKRIQELEAAKVAAEAAASSAQATAASAQAAADTAQAALDAKPAEPPADIWKPADATPTTEPAAAPGEPPVDAAAPGDAEPVAGDTTTEPTPADATTEPTPADTTAEPTPADTTAVTQPVPEPAPAATEPVASTPAQPAADGGLMSNPWLLGGIGAAALALIGLLFARRRRKDDEAPAGYAATTDAADADDHGGFFPQDRAPAAVAVGDAEEEELLDQVAMNPANLRLRLDLLRHYHERGNAGEFENAARGLRAQIASEDQPEWQEATRLAATILPGHAMFAHRDEIPSEVSFDEAEHAAEPIGDSMDFSQFEESPPTPSAADAEPKLQAAAEPSFDFDFDLDTPTVALEPVAVSEPEVAAQAVASDAPAAAVDSEISFDFDLDAPAAAESAAAEPAPEPEAPVAAKEEFSLDLPEIDFASMDAGHAGEAAFEEPAPVASNLDDELGDLGVFGDDAVATKLDLARAYMDMGDPDGARSMLEEVIGEGNAEQQNEARQLLSGLS